MKDEPDDMPLNVQHVKDFLVWYRKQVTGRHYDVEFSPDWWGNAFKDLNLGQLRNGIRAYQRLSSKPWLSPPEFWALCKGTQDEASINRFRAMREAVSAEPPIQNRKQRAATRVKEEVVRPRIPRSGENDYHG